MDPKAQSAANRVYQDFEPFFEWTEDEGSATLVVMLPGFIKDQLRVQVTSTGVLRINGERQVIENIWRRFAKEFSIPSYCDTNEVGAKFEGGILTIKFPKLITPAKPLEQEETITNPPPEEAPMPQNQIAEPQAPPPQVVDQQEEKEKIEKVVDQKEPKPTSDEKEQETEKNKTEEVAPDKNVAQEKVETKGVSETTEVKTPKSQGKPQAKMTQRLKTRLLDFNISLRSADDQNVNQGISGSCNTGLEKRKVLMNVIVAILLVMVIGVYVKNALRWRSSSSYQGEPKFQEL